MSEYALIDRNENTIKKIYSVMPVLYKSTEQTEENRVSVEELPLLNIYLIIDDLPENIDTLRNKLIIRPTSEWIVDSVNKKVKRTYIIRPLSFSDKKNLLLNDLAALRYEKETSGIIINGIMIYTDRGSQAMLASTKSVISSDSNKIINWKCVDCWMELNSSNIFDICDNVSDYVEKCFNNEKVHWANITEIEDDDWESLASIDITTGWPTNIY